MGLKAGNYSCRLFSFIYFLLFVFVHILLIAMKKKIIFLSAFLSLGCVVQAQVTFPAGTNLCESTPWKLVWHDEFDGTSLDNNKWYTFSDDNNWSPQGTIYVPPINVEGRRGNMVNYLDANVTVSNGSCKLSAKYEPNNILGSYQNFSSGYIKARLIENGLNHLQYFNKGKFEIKAKLPKVKNVWATFWLWVGGVSAEGPGGSEIDMFEYMPGSTNELNTNTFTLHGWNRGPGWPVSPNSTADHATFNVNNIDSWHIYSCEWDENFVRLYVDGVLQLTRTRYKQANGLGGYFETASCVPTEGVTYYKDPMATATFPFPDEYLSLICSLDYRSELEWAAGEPTRVFEIDYVRVYQRTPQPNLKDLCSSVSGPSNICLNVPTTYYASVGEGTFNNWTVSSNVQVLSTGISIQGQPYITVKGIANNPAWIVANVQGSPPSCAPSQLQITVGKPTPPSAVINVSATSNPAKKSITITFAAPPAGSTYTWHVSSTGGALYDGTNAASRTFLMLNGDVFSYWTYSTNACGESEWINYGYKLVNGVLQPYDLQRPANPFEDDHDLGLLGELTEAAGSDATNNHSIALFPNPAGDKLNIDMGLPRKGLEVKIIDLNGKTIYTDKCSEGNNSRMSIDVSKYAPGMYYVVIRDESGELLRSKFVKK